MTPSGLIWQMFPLTRASEWAAEVGLALAARRPEWHGAYRADNQPLGLSQADGYGFLAFCERAIALEQLMPALFVVYLRGPYEWEDDLIAARAQLGRSWKERPASSELGELAGEPAVLVSPAACRASGLGYGDTVAWTHDALQGASLELVGPAFPESDSGGGAVRSSAGDEEKAVVASAGESVGASGRMVAASAADASVGAPNVEEPGGEDLRRLCELVHDIAYLDGLESLVQRGEPVSLTPETQVTRERLAAAKAGVAALVYSTRRALDGERSALLTLARPGSHHASPGRAGGTCLLNGLTISARCAITDHGLSRVAILDLDAHHGNGSEDACRGEDRLLALSVHQAQPFYPGTGGACDDGSIVNLPVRAGEPWRAAALEAVERLRSFAPELILVELSGDAHESDPASDLAATDADYEDVLGELVGLGAPVVYELGAGLSARAWHGVVRAAVRAHATAQR